MEWGASYKVCFLVDAHAWGGAEQHVVNLAQALPETVEVSALATHAAVAHRLQSHGVATSWLRNTVPAWRRRLASIRPDIVHIGRPALPSARYAILAALYGRHRVVIVDHGVAPGLSWRGKAWQRFVANSVDAMVTVSEASRVMLREFADLRDVPIEVIPNGIPEPNVCGGPGRPRRAVFVGRLSPEKNIPLALRLMSVCPQWSLDIVGTGTQEQALREQAALLRVHDRVRFLGHHEDVAPYICGGQAFILPSLRENMPLVILEAMGLQRPVIASAVGAVPEVLADGAGCPVDIDSPDGGLAQMSAILHSWGDDADLANRVALNGRARMIAKYTSQVMANRFDRLYRQILS